MIKLKKKRMKLNSKYNIRKKEQIIFFKNKEQLKINMIKYYIELLKI